MERITKERRSSTYICAYTAAVLLAAFAAAFLLCSCAKHTEPVDVVQAASGAAGSSAPAVAEDIPEDVIVITAPPPTPEPTPTPAPTEALPELVPCGPAKGYTAKSGVNLRSKPSTGSDIIDTLDKAVELTILGEAGTWYNVSIDGTAGFISQEFVGTGDVPASLTVKSLKRRNGVTIVGGVNLRTGPSTRDEAVDKLDVLTPFTVTGETEDWFRIEYQGETGYISKEFAEYSDGYYEQEELYLVAQLVHQEAKYTSLEGKIAVANVVYNRIRSSKFPNTIGKVVFQKGQFSPADDEDKLRSVRPSSTSVEAVIEIFVRGKTILPKNVLYFRAARLGTQWAASRTYYNTYGGNCFYK